MPLDPERGCWTSGTVGSAVHEGDPLTVEQIRALPKGAEVVVTWSGGNGPHRYHIAHRDATVYAAVRSPFLLVAPLLARPDQRIPLHRVTVDARLRASSESRASEDRS